MGKKIAIALLIVAGSAIPEDRRTVKYEIDGTAKYAHVTWNNAAGGTEQKEVKLPHEEEFFGPVGMLAYVSAQKAKVTKTTPFLGTEILSDGVYGTVTVKVKVNYRVIGEAESDAPFGIAKASGKVE